VDIGEDLENNKRYLTAFEETKNIEKKKYIRTRLMIKCYF
jgi:hypothetical protein